MSNSKSPRIPAEVRAAYKDKKVTFTWTTTVVVPSTFNFVDDTHVLTVRDEAWRKTKKTAGILTGVD